MNEPVQRGKTPSPSDAEWCRFAREEARRAVEVCRDSAKALLTALSVMVPAHAAVLALGGASVNGSPLVVVPLFFWFLALLCLVAALVPWSWKSVVDAPDQIQAEFQRLAKGKRWYVGLAGILMSLGVLLLAIGVIVNRA